MPIYEYECPKCGRFDALQKMSAPALKKHDVCGSKVHKVMSASAFAFKGSGFYITDYKGKNASAPRPEKSEAKAEKCEKADPKAPACASCPASKSAA
jgi:putative FmdB family regulatory protein